MTEVDKGNDVMNADKLCATIGKTLPSRFECLPAPQEGVRVRTPLMYPDGGIVDVFVLERGNGYIVTDFGDALSWFRMQSVNAQLSVQQNLMIKEICHTLGIELHSGQLVLRSGVDDTLEETVLRVAQAVVRVSDAVHSNA
ncbi:MAG: DUF1828 domain-containing protein [Candidatus Poribacteria bacterium]|nr:DUF1828 domain-containing protein [Candidatus Poribacteria bacterium]